MGHPAEAQRSGFGGERIAAKRRRWRKKRAGIEEVPRLAGTKCPGAGGHDGEKRSDGAVRDSAMAVASAAQFAPTKGRYI